MTIVRVVCMWEDNLKYLHYAAYSVMRETMMVIAFPLTHSLAPTFAAAQGETGKSFPIFALRKFHSM